MSIGLLVPVVLFFGLSVIANLGISGAAMKNIEHKRQPD